LHFVGGGAGIAKLPVVAPRVAPLLGSLGVLLALAPSAGRAERVYYQSGWSAPFLHAETSSGWTRAPGVAMKRLGQGWWRADVPGLKQFLPSDGHGGWDRPAGGGNYTCPSGTRELWLEGGAVACAAPGSGKSRNLVFRSPRLGGDRRVVVHLPPGYGVDPERRYPVLYLQDGQNLFDPAAPFGGWAVDRATDGMPRLGKSAPVIVVGIENGGARRMLEYTPSRDPGERGGGGADRYLDFITKELKPAIDRSFRTLADRGHTAIGGSSLGGLLSLYAGITRPRVFGRVLAMSPSLWWNGGELVKKVAEGTRPRGLRIYLDSGGAHDGRENTDRLRDLLAGKGMRFGRDLWHWCEPTHEHNEAAWRDRFPRALSSLFPPE
jgi:predicted alpha/beta superfamily hydrolase